MPTISNVPKKKWDKPPVKVDDVLETEVTNMGKSGDPMVKAEKYILFIKDAGEKKPKVGDKVKVKVTKTLHSFGFAELVP